MPDLKTCAIHTMTNKPWTLAQCCEKYAAAGIGGISVWRNVIEPIGIDEAARIVRASGLKVPALVRGGFFPAFDPAKRDSAHDDNRRCLDEAAAIGAEMVVLVVGAVPGMPLPEARKQVTEGIGRLLDHARSVNVKLAIEPLHPMYAGDRSCINRMKEAREVFEQLQSPLVGIACDVYHVWWDPDLEYEIALAGRQGTLFGFHVCDWRLNTRDLLNDRGLMGDGCINLKHIRQHVASAGFRGLNEVEIFSTEKWAMDQEDYLRQILAAYQQHV
ncbi:MAG TPA: sugar phosphate isomerase/epimerase family protein [Tepidisphaeraceae bacterium]|nr:sugar phosphate isomerase/epimerase family protein [Tepidisphaeraceae bacterium]